MSTFNDHSITINRPLQQVFDYATTPMHWPEWHPSSLRLSGDIRQSAPSGARFEEDIRAAGREGHAIWQVTDRTADVSWKATARLNNGVTLSVSYLVSGDENTTRFQRILRYDLPNPWLKFLNFLVLGRRVERESARSLRQLKERLETR